MNLAPTRTVLAAGVTLAALLFAGCLPGDGVNATAPSTPTATGPTASPTPTAAADPSPATRANFRNIEYDGWSFDIVEMPLEEWDVRVDWAEDPDGSTLADAVEAGDDVAVATNAGIFTPGLNPGGLLVSDGEELRALNLREGSGNFHLMPNGVFAVYDDGTAAVMESSQYTSDGVQFATQSGPALLLDGEIHPQFGEESGNITWRNGVGVSPDGSTVYFAISNHMVNLHTFAAMFRDELGCDDALYLDGTISAMWVEGEREFDLNYGPFAGVITASPTTGG